MPPKKPKKQEQPDDEFIKMLASDLETNLKLFKERLADARSRRNYIQMDRDMIEQFCQNTELDIKETGIGILNKEADAQKMQQAHSTEVKVFLQKIKLLEYEQERSNGSIEVDGEDAKGHENKYYEDRMRQMKKVKHQLKKRLGEDQLLYIDRTKVHKSDHDHNQDFMRSQHSAQLTELERKYEAKLEKMQEELELKKKVEIHELQERKNLHINELIRNHEEAFAELKNYYNETTRDNLRLIKSHKAEIKKITEDSEKIKKKIAELRDFNAQIRDPLTQLELKRDRLKADLRQFDKHKMSRDNYRSKLAALRQKSLQLQRQFVELSEKLEKVLVEKKDLTNKQTKLTDEVRRHAQMANVVLSRKLQTEREQLEQKEAQLHQLLQNGAVEPSVAEELRRKVKDSIETKNLTVKNLRYNIHHATKAYNDAIRVYEAKLVQFGIPAEELGFQTLPTTTSTMPAGLVSS